MKGWILRKWGLSGWLVASFLAIVVAFSAPLNAETSAEDRGYLAGLLESSLGGEGREVTIRGFKGALSSEATIDEIEIADFDGTWLRISNATLVWSRAALLSGRIDVDTLAAEKIELFRLPNAEGSGLPAAEAAPFRLPELPVSIEIGSLTARKITLGESVLGTPARLSLSARASLIDGAIDVTFNADRTDGQRGSFEGAVTYANENAVLGIDLQLAEGEGGLAAKALNLPENPSVDLTIQGAGPLDAFGASLALSTNGAERLRGSITLNAVGQTQSSEGLEVVNSASDLAFVADVAGDVAPLFLPEYQTFFGDDVSLKVRGTRLTSGAVELDTLNAKTSALDLNGSLRLNTALWPEFIDFNGVIETSDGAPILLPIGGIPTTVGRVSLDVEYDSAKADTWRARIGVGRFARDTVFAWRLGIEGGGTLVPAGASIGSIAGVFALEALDLDVGDAGLNEALGETVRASFFTEYTQGQPFELSNLTVGGDEYGLRGTARVSGLDDAFETVFDVSASADNLARFSAVAGMPLSGTAAFSMTGNADAGGRFSVVAQGTGQSLRIGEPMADALLRGTSEISADLRRDEAGTRLETFSLKNSQLSAEATASLSSTVSSANFDATLADLGLIIANVSGPLNVTGSADSAGGNWEVTTALLGPAGARANTQGSVSRNGIADLIIDGTVPLQLANPFIEPRTIQGRADVAARLQGPLGLAALSGMIDLNDLRVSAPSVGIALTQGVGQIRISQSTAQVQLRAQASTGGAAQVGGSIALSKGLGAQLDIRLEDVGVLDLDLYRTQVSGDLDVSGLLAAGPRISGKLMLGETDVTIPSTGLASFGIVPEIVHRGASAGAVATQRRAGLTREDAASKSNSPLQLDISIDAPQQIFVRGRGLDAELGGQLRIQGSPDALVSVGRFDLLRGRLDLLSKRFALDEGSVQLIGDFDPFIRFVASTETGAGTASVILSGRASDPEVTFEATPAAAPDEVLAQIFFEKGVYQLSAFQALQLATAVRRLQGRGGEGVVAKLRRGLELDDLDVSTDEDGSVAVRAGKYVSQNVYTEVEVGDESAVSLNIDLMRNLVGRGSVSSDGKSSIGLFFEKDY